MKAYQDIVARVLQDGVWKENRTGTRTKVVPGVFFEHNMGKGFPLLTCRKLPIKAIAVELEGFIQGITSKKWYQERGCNFWDGWANPNVVASVAASQSFAEPGTEPWDRKALARSIDDLGPMGYSYQQRFFNLAYHLKGAHDKLPKFYCDQLQYIVDTLKSNPNDRRMVSSMWNPLQLNQMALPPCTVAWVVTVTGDTLNLSWFQRSCDTILGLPSDIANNALLLKLLCAETGFHAGKLTGLLVDCHIYENHIPAANELLTREPRPLPSMGIVTPPGEDGKYKFDFFKWTHKDINLLGYNPHPKLDMGAIAI